MCYSSNYFLLVTTRDITFIHFVLFVHICFTKNKRRAQLIDLQEQNVAMLLQILTHAIFHSNKMLLSTLFWQNNYLQYKKLHDRILLTLASILYKTKQLTLYNTNEMLSTSYCSILNLAYSNSSMAILNTLERNYL